MRRRRSSSYLEWYWDGVTYIEGPYRRPSRLSRICNWFAWLLGGEP